MSDYKLLNYLDSFLTETRMDRFKKILSQRTKHFTVAIEDVYHLHNTSAVIRSCDVFGIQEAHIIEEVNSKKIDREIALGSQKWVDIFRYQSSKECLTNLKSQGYQIVASTPHENESMLADFDISRKSCFCFGKETDGLSDYILEEADSFLKIPMVGFTESLNISVAAAIILQHVTTKLKESDLDWKLSDDEQIDKRIDWSKKTIKSISSVMDHYNTNQ
jgi:tRNA (guanosine-2'-O-)-methyltransferase